jgi:hypothetical protein
MRSTDTLKQTVELLLANDARAASAAQLLSEAGCWVEAVALARTWKVTPHLAARIQTLNLQPPAAGTLALRRDFLQAYAQSNSRATKTIDAMQALEASGIPAVAFKGIASMAVLYGGPKHRTIGDGDLLILRKDLRSVLDCLERNGFVRRGGETLDEYLAFVQNAPRFAGNQALALYGAGGGEIDLHWEIPGSGLRVNEILERHARANLLGVSIPVVNATDGFLLSIHHAIREDLAVASICRDLLDIRLWCQRLEETRHLESALKSAVESHSLAAALAATSVLKGYDDTTSAARAADRLSSLATAAQRRSAAGLTELFHYQIRHGRLEKDVLLLVHARPLRQILQGLAADWPGYRRSMKTLDIQLGDNLPLHKRVSLLVQSFPGPRGLRLARTLARVKYRTP